MAGEGLTLGAAGARNHLEASSLTYLVPGLQGPKGWAQLGLKMDTPTWDLCTWLEPLTARTLHSEREYP